MEAVLSLFGEGGPLMWPILGCSVLGVAITAERLIYFLAVGRRTRALNERLIPLLEMPDQQSNALALCHRDSSAFSRLCVSVLEAKNLGLEGMRTEASAAAARETVLFERYLGLLSTLGTIAPLLGLLGTVLGMIEAFHVIAAQGTGTPATLGGGISQALITTAAGLSVAIPLVLLHRFVVGRLNRLMLTLDSGIQEVIRRVSRAA